MLIRADDVTYIKTQFNHLKLCNFISSLKMVKNTIKLCRRFFLHKSNMKRKPGVESLMSNSKLFRFITLGKLIKTPENFVQGFLSVKLTNVCHKNRGEGLVSGSL